MILQTNLLFEKLTRLSVSRIYPTQRGGQVEVDTFDKKSIRLPINVNNKFNFNHIILKLYR